MNAKLGALLDLLDGIGMYNDKGLCWANHSPEEIAATRADFRTGLDGLLAEIGPANLPAAAVHLLQNDALPSDGSGDLASQIRALLQHG